ncbi:hypothetical protein ABN028_19995 [Actinopolymorpha sp. B17G11]|uniref:hypothetical protein n=1 Tax=Actinopolymorpha sp. B17G11 TaxID=3160861 RepID=UPI0032E4E36D
MSPRRIRERLRPATWKITATAVAAVAVAVASLGYGVARIYTQVEDLQSANVRLEDRADRADAARDKQAVAAEQLSEQVRALGAEPVVTPAPAPPPPRSGGVSAAEVRSIVADELDDRRLELTPAQIASVARVAASQVPRPRDGSTPTAADIRPVVRDVVAAVCSGDACRGAKGDQGDRGEAGEPGEPGRPGEPGDTGPPGPGPTDEQIDARLAAYCAERGGCQGPPGPAGEDGADGADGADGRDGRDGRGIQSGPDFVRDESGNCVARTTYTDGTTYESDAGEAACLLMRGTTAQ